MGADASGWWRSSTDPSAAGDAEHSRLFGAAKRHVCSRHRRVGLVALFDEPVTCCSCTEYLRCSSSPENVCGIAVGVGHSSRQTRQVGAGADLATALWRARSSECCKYLLDVWKRVVHISKRVVQYMESGVGWLMSSMRCVLSGWISRGRESRDGPPRELA